MRHVVKVEYIYSVLNTMDRYKSVPPLSTRITNVLLDHEISTVHGFLNHVLEYGWSGLAFRGLGRKSLYILYKWCYDMQYMTRAEFTYLISFYGFKKFN